ncbi:MAG: recombinase zinc beta ribbon domain-containing protein [Acidobacteria bacterium]|nr:recombinase zinc beta ribbon domain-containing protein [Acidobacteriota bacterium]
MLRNPVYAGIIDIPSWGIRTQGCFEPIISLALYELVQKGTTPSATTSGEGQKDEFPLRVFIRCADCQKGLTGSYSRGRRGKLYPYYFCRTKGCRGAKFRRDDLHAAFEALLRELEPADDFLPLFRAVLEDTWRKRNAEEQKAAEAIHKRIAGLQIKKQRIFDAFIDKEISKEVYEDQTTTVQTAIDEAQAAIAEPGATEQELYSLLDLAESVMSDLGWVWASAGGSVKSRIQTAVFPQGVVADSGGVQTPEPLRLFKSLQVENVDEIKLASPGGFEPPLPP